MDSRMKYYELSGKELRDLAKELFKKRASARKSIVAFLEEYRSKGVHFSSIDGSFIGISANECPEKWRPTSSRIEIYVPDKRTKVGKAIISKINGLLDGLNINGILSKKVSYSGTYYDNFYSFPNFFHIPSSGRTFFGVPECSDGYTPVPGVAPIKGSELFRLVEDYNEQLSKKEEAKNDGAS